MRIFYHSKQRAFCNDAEICYNTRVKNYAFIDSQNLHKSMEVMGYKIDYRRFRLWLKNRHDVERAFMYFGYMEGTPGKAQDVSLIAD